MAQLRRVTSRRTPRCRPDGRARGTPAPRMQLRGWRDRGLLLACSWRAVGSLLGNKDREPDGGQSRRLALAALRRTRGVGGAGQGCPDGWGRTAREGTAHCVLGVLAECGASAWLRSDLCLSCSWRSRAVLSCESAFEGVSLCMRSYQESCAWLYVRWAVFSLGTKDKSMACESEAEGVWFYVRERLRACPGCAGSG